MPLFRVYEVQEETRMRRWYFDVEAESADVALEQVQAGDYEECIDAGEVGDSDFGHSGWAAKPIEDESDTAPDSEGFSEAREDYLASM